MAIKISSSTNSTKKISIFALTIVCSLLFLLLPKKILANSILYQDSFSSDASLANWTPASEWKTNNQSLKVFINLTDTLSRIYYKGGETWKDYSLKMKIMSENGVDQKIGFRVKDAKNHYSVTFRYFQEEHGGNILLHSRVDNVRTLLDSRELNKGELELNNWYNIQIKVENYNIKVYLENKNIFDFNDESELFDKGGITLQAWSGNIAKTSMRFDELLVESLDSSPPSPILLLPGLGASWNTQAMLIGGQSNSWGPTPFVHIYDNFSNTLTSNGYTQGQNYETFYYDWRKQVYDLSLPEQDLNNQYLVKDLKEKVDQFYEQNGQQKINLVGHSMGGLLSRAYTQRYGTEKINEIVTVGSPHAGATKAFETWEGAKVIDPERITWADIGMKLLLYINSLKYPTFTETIRNVTPSVKNLIPTFDFLKDSQNADQIIPADTIIQKNQFLLDLNNSLDNDTKNILATLGGKEENQTHNTLEWLKVEPRNWLDIILGQWEDGKPKEEIFSDQGDLTVLLKSASISDVPAFQVAGTHDAIMQNEQGLNQILQALDLNFSPTVNTLSLPELPLLAFWLHSPAYIKVTGNGKDVGYQTGVCNTCFYSEEDGLILINNAPNGKYHINLTPKNGGGNYSLDIGQVTLNGDFWHSLVGEIKTEDKNYTINFDSQNPKKILLVDPQGENLLAQAIERLEKLIEYTNNLPVKYAVKKRLAWKMNSTLKKLNQAEKQLNNNPQRAANYMLQGLIQIYQTRLYIDKFNKQNKLSDEQKSYLKNEIQSIIELLNQSFVTIKENSPKKISQRLAERYLNSVKKVYQKLENSLKNSSEANPALGAVVLKIQEMLDMAENAFEEGNFAKSYINSFGARFLILEARRI